MSASTINTEKWYDLEDKLFHVIIQSVNSAYSSCEADGYNARITIEFLDGPLKGKTVSFEVEEK